MRDGRNEENVACQCATLKDNVLSTADKFVTLLYIFICILYDSIIFSCRFFQQHLVRV